MRRDVPTTRCDIFMNHSKVIGTRRTRSQKRSQTTVKDMGEPSSKRRKILEVELEDLHAYEVTKLSPDSSIKPSDMPESPENEVIQQEELEEEEDDMGQFEKKRLQNIRDNAAFLSQLGIREAQTNLKKFTQSKQFAPSSRGLKEKKQIEILPRRSSLRLKRVDPEGVPLPELPTLPADSEWDDNPRKPAGPLEMGEYLRNVDDDEVGAKFLTVLRGMGCQKSQGKNKMEPLTSYMKSLSSLQITEKRVAKVTPSRIFSVAIHPAEERVLACAGDKWGKLAFWDVESRQGQDGVFCYSPHSRPVNCIKFHPQKLDHLYSCSYDGTLRCAHFQKGVFDEVYSTPEDDDIRLTSFDFLSSDSIIITQSDGCVAVSDFRTPVITAENIYQTHHRVVKCVSVHPTQCHYFATASNDGNVCLWDLRQMSKKKPNSIDILPHSKSVDSAYFSPVTGRHLLTTSMDDKIRVFDFDANAGPDIRMKLSLRHFNHTGRWLSNFRATWHPSRDDLFVVGSMNRPRQIEIYGVDGQERKLKNADWLGSVCSLNVFHPSRSIVVGGNSSGRLHVFM